MNIEALKTAGIALTQVDLSITPILLNKLPLNLKNKFIENLKEGTWTIEALIKFLNKELCVDRQCDFLSINNQNNYHGTSKFRQYNVNNSRSDNQNKYVPRNSYVSNAGKVNDSVPKCHFCNMSHLSKNCTKYETQP